MKKYSDNRYQELYSQEQEFEVLFLGTSHMLNAVSPMEMWKDYGIVSYNIASPSSRIATSYWLLKNALQYTTPKLIVVDCAFLVDEKISPNLGALHMAIDSIPFGKFKIQAVCDLVSDWKERLEMLIPFSVYHSRWDELEKNDFFYEYVPGKMGYVAEMGNQSVDLSEMKYQDDIEIDNVSTVYLKKIIEECKDQNIEVLLTYIPEQNSSVEENSYIKKLSEEYAIHFLGHNELAKVLNPETDFANGDHLNPSGAGKMSHYLGGYIVENYAITDYRNDAAYDIWEQYYYDYLEYVKSKKVDEK
jgi:hypothetical protein